MGMPGHHWRHSGAAASYPPKARRSVADLIFTVACHLLRRNNGRMSMPHTPAPAGAQHHALPFGTFPHAKAVLIVSALLAATLVTLLVTWKFFPVALKDHVQLTPVPARVWVDGAEASATVWHDDGRLGDRPGPVDVLYVRFDTPMALGVKILGVDRNHSMAGPAVPCLQCFDMIGGSLYRTDMGGLQEFSDEIKGLGLSYQLHMTEAMMDVHVENAERVHQFRVILL